MSDYHLEVLLRLRKHAVDEALLEMSAAVFAAQAEERERKRLSAEADALRRRAFEAPPAACTCALQRAARFQARLRSAAQVLRECMRVQDLRLREAETRARSLGHALALARAEHEAMVSHRRQWLQERCIARDAAEEREADDWVGSTAGASR